MSGRLLTRRTLPTLVAALTLGIAGVAHATSTASVSPDGTLTITGDTAQNFISIYKLAPVDNTTGNATAACAATPMPSNCHEVIIVGDGDSGSMPAGAPTIPGTPVPNLLQPSSGCVADDDSTKTVKCSPLPSGPAGSGGTSNGKFTKVVANLDQGGDFFGEFVGQDHHTKNGLPAYRTAFPLGIPVTVDGGQGDDVIFGSRGVDTEYGGAGDDDLRGGPGNDTIFPGSGGNQVQGGADADTVNYSATDSSDSNYNGNLGRAVSLDDEPNDGPGCTLDPHDPNGQQNCSSKDNVASDIENITTGNGADLISGTADNNIINTGGGADVIYGGGGSDVINASGDSANRKVWGDFGPYDTGHGTITLPQCTKTGCSNGSSAADNITTGDGADTIFGGSEADTSSTPAVVAVGDTITAGAGDNVVNGEGGNDTVTTTTGKDTISGGTGADVIKAGDGGTAANPQTVDGGIGDDQITVLEKVSTITGGDGADTISAGNGGDSIDAGNANDKVSAGNGDNTINLGAGDDTPIDGSKMAGTGKDTINGGDGADTITDAGGDNPLITGGAGADHITVDSGNNHEIDGDADNDVITTGAGNDFVFGGHKGEAPGTVDGNDTITTADGSDYVEGGSGADNMNLGANSGATGTYPSKEEDVTGPNGGSYGDTVSYAEKTDPVWAVVVPEGTNGGGSGTYCDPSKTAQYQAMTPPRSCEGDTVIGAENIRGGSGDDTLAGDRLDNVAGVLKCTTSSPNDFNNVLIGGAGNDTLFGCAQKDTLFGDAGDDVLDGGSEADYIHGGSNVDASGNPITNGPGADHDAVSYQSCVAPQCGTNGDGVNVTLGNGQADDGPKSDTDGSQLDNLFGDIENITGSDSNDTLVGSGADNVIKGQGGDDLIDGGFGADTLDGGQGSDTVSYNGVSVTTHGTTSQASQGRDSNVTVTLDDQPGDGAAGENDNVQESVENLIGGPKDDTFTAQPINAATNATASNWFVGNDGNDRFDGGYGADEFEGDAGDDTVVYGNRAADETVTATINDLPTSGSSNDLTSDGMQGDLIHLDIEDLTGGQEIDKFTGSTHPNVIRGGAGDDVLDGLSGDDRVFGDDGNDSLQGGPGVDRLQGGRGADAIAGAGGTDTVLYDDSWRTNPVDVSLDNLGNDGEAGENDNVAQDVELCVGCATSSGGIGAGTADSGDNPPAGGSTSGGTTTGSTTPTDTTTQPSTPDTSSSNTNTDSSSSSSSSSNNTSQDANAQPIGGSSTKVDPTTEQKAPATSSQQASSLQTSTSVSRPIKGYRSVLVRGRILVKARKGVAKASASCKGGGKVLVTIRKGRKVVGKRLVTVTKTCTFLAPVTLKKGTTGKLKVEVKFLGNRALKPTKRTTKLQVNG